MNSPEAQFILTACRPGGADAEEARVSEALALAQDDPQLDVWWEDQQAFVAALFRQQMADYLAQRWEHRLDASPDSYAKLEQWLADQTAPVPENLPARLTAPPSFGCKVIEWRGTKATLICFNVSDANTTVHLLIVDRAAVRDAAPETQFTNAGRWSSATWSRHGKTYVALCGGSSAALKKVLQPGA